MLSKIKVVSVDEFKLWYEKIDLASQAEIKDGKTLIQAKGCIECHSIDGSESLGPTLKGIYNRKTKVLTNGVERKIISNEEYIKNSILNPKADVVKNFNPIMPSQKDRLTEKEVEEIIKYLKELK
jgi:cytochrome c oxidase subunit 2